MGLFGLSGSKSKSRSESSSFDNLDSYGLGISRSSSVGGATSRGGSASRQSIAFEEIFADLFGGASNVAGKLAGRSGDLTGAANMLFGSGTQFLDQLSEGGEGAGYLESRLAERDGLAEEEIGLLETDIERFLGETVMPGITESGVQAGTLGGGRGEVARGIAGRGATEAFARGATDIRRRDQQARDVIAQSLLADESGRAATGASVLPQLFGLAESGFLAELSPYAALGGILGGPTTLSESESFDMSDAFDQALAEAFDMQRTRGRAGSRSTSSSSSKSFGLEFS